MSESKPHPELPETIQWHVIPERRRTVTRRNLLLGMVGLTAAGGVLWSARGMQAPSTVASVSAPPTSLPQAAAPTRPPAPPTAAPAAATRLPTLAPTSAPTAVPGTATASVATATAMPTAEPTTPATEVVVAGPGATQTGAPVAAKPVTTAESTRATTAPAAIGGPAEQMVIGHSVEGREITAFKLGNGPVAVALIGDIHGAWEPRAYQVAQVGLEYFRGSRSDIPEGASVYVILTTNPDAWENGDRFRAKADGSGGQGDAVLSEFAFNARGIDLNRNFPVKWSDRPCGGERFRLHYGNMCMQGKAGTTPFSEPETRAYRDFILSNKIKMALTYHENRFPSISIREGGGGQSEPFALQMASLFGYEYLPVWPDYPVTGQAQDWLDSQGAMGAEIELRHHTLEPRLDEALNIAAMQLAINVAVRKFG